MEPEPGETWWEVFVITDQARFKDCVLAYDADDAHTSAAENWPTARAITVLDD